MPYVNDENVYQVEGSPVIYRYMDLTKYLSLLKRKALFFVRVDLLQDPFEGGIPLANREAMLRWYDEMQLVGYLNHDISKEQKEINVQNSLKFQKSLRPYTVVNCWHDKDYENALMWRAYSKPDAGIAIKSTYSMLRDSIHTADEQVYIGKIHYKDYRKAHPYGNSNLPFMHKEKSYIDENEIRAFFEVAGRTRSWDWSKQENKNGVFVNCDPSILIDEVIISPFADDTFIEIVQDVSKKYGISKSVTLSHLCGKNLLYEG